MRTIIVLCVSTLALLAACGSSPQAPPVLDICELAECGSCTAYGGCDCCQFTTCRESPRCDSCAPATATGLECLDSGQDAGADAGGCAPGCVETAPNVCYCPDGGRD